MRRLTALRLAAILVPSALALHEGIYLLAGGSERGSHGYLAELVPLLAALAASLAIASLLLPALGVGAGGNRVRSRPFAIAGALIAMFAVQEAAEVFLLGGGAGQLAATLAAAWALLPLAFLLGLLGAGAIETLERAARGIARLLEPRRTRPPLPAAAARPQLRLRTSLASSSPLAFGLARRPPPPAF